MKQGRHERLQVELPLCALGCNRDGVGDVGLAIVTELAQMRFIGEPIGLANLLDVRV